MIATYIAAKFLPLFLVAAGLLGLVVGSFIATLVIRWPRGEGMGGRSSCDQCKEPIAVLDLVPLFGWARRRGRCRHCKAPIDWRHPVIELSAALLAIIMLAAAPGPEGIIGMVFAWFLLAMAALDAEHYWLPDRLTLPFLGLGLLLGFGTPTERLLGALIGGGTFLLLRFAFQRLTGREGLGLGDVKLIAGLGAWLSWSSLPPLILLASLIGLGAAMFSFSRSRRAGGATLAMSPPVPFGACLAVAALPIWMAQAAGMA
jgi:leader peptidase (prepilin peptidase)/N-methyltransferase